MPRSKYLAPFRALPEDEQRALMRIAFRETIREIRKLPMADRRRLVGLTTGKAATVRVYSGKKGDA